MARASADTDGDGIPDTSDPDDDGDGIPDTEEAASEAQENVLQNSEPEKQSSSEIRVRKGGKSQADKDFDNMRIGPFTQAPNGTKVAPGPNGTTIVRRDQSSDGRVTVEIQRKTDSGNTRTTKIRYE